MAILVVDSGSSKTHWVFIENKKTTNISTLGFNPYYYSTEVLLHEIETKLLPFTSTSIDTIYFYGSGISTKNKQQLIYDILAKTFPGASIEIEHDLLAAARGLFKNQPGIACILGTGSNSCVYDGEKITHTIPSLGYFFADEGSGTHLGKLLTEDYLRNNLPLDLKQKLETEKEINFEKVLDHIYNQKYPNKYLASFSPFVAENIAHPYLNELVKKSFRLFFKTYITRYPYYKLSSIKFTGSVAVVHKNILREVAREFHLEIEEIVKSPVSGLIEYHSG